MRARQAYRDAPQCVCSPTGSLDVCRGPTSRVVTGTIPATMFVYTEPLTHPNNQRLRVFLIPTQSQWSQVELATGTIRYSNTPGELPSPGASSHTLSPLFVSSSTPEVTLGLRPVQLRLLLVYLVNFCFTASKTNQSAGLFMRTTEYISQYMLGILHCCGFALELSMLVSVCACQSRYVVKHSLTFHSWPQYYVHCEGEHIFVFHTSHTGWGKW